MHPSKAQNKQKKGRKGQNSFGFKLSFSYIRERASLVTAGFSLSMASCQKPLLLFKPDPAKRASSTGNVGPRLLSFLREPFHSLLIHVVPLYIAIYNFVPAIGITTSDRCLKQKLFAIPWNDDECKSIENKLPNNRRCDSFAFTNLPCKRERSFSGEAL